MTAADLASLGIAAKRDLLARRLRVAAGTPAEAPVSFAQQRLWFLDRLEPGHCVYNVCRAVRLQGTLDVPALERALEQLVRRHAALRTTFSAAGGIPRQVIAPGSPFHLRRVAVEGVTPGDVQDPRLRAQLVEESRQPFDLAAGPLFRAVLFACAPDDHVLLLVLHHVIADGTSMGVAFRDLTVLYNALRGGHPPSLPPPGMTYAGFVRWQRDWFEGTRLQSELAYWRRQLEGAPPLLQIPADRPRPAVQSYRGDLIPFALPPTALEGLVRLAQQEKVTLFIALMAAFKALLHRYTGMDDVIVGTPVANRQRPELDSVVGFFANSLAIRTDLSGEPTFRQLLAREREAAAGAFLHQDLPFERLVEELHPERDLGRTPVFQVMLALLNDPLPGLKLEGLEASEIVTGNGSAKFDLFLSLEQGPGGVRGFWEYATDLFDAGTIHRLSRHFLTLLSAALGDPDAPVSRLPLIDGDETRRLLFECNRTERSYPQGLRIHDLFDSAVKAHAAHPALVYCGPTGEGTPVRWSYAELDARVNRLVHLLRARGVGPEVLVGVFLERSPELIVAMLAILKAGGAYVPLDPAYPRERIAFMLEDTRAPVLVTEEALAGRLPETRSQLLVLDRPETAEALASAPSGSAGPPVRGAQPSNLAYLIFTSGSTGRPKGVAIEHRNAVAFIQWALEVYSREDLAGTLFSTSVCFDLSVFEVFVTLAAGGTILVAENALAVPALACREEITLINTVPSAMAELVRLDAVPSSVRVVNLAGEPLSVDLVRRLYGLPQVQRVYDLYGPSEDTTYSTFTLRRADGPATIGRPIANTQVYLLDAQRQLVPYGVPGELYLGGAGLARGYLNRPELTADRFVPNPFRGTPGAYLYRTGDLARYLPDGNLEYLGRLDHQVKIRGFRIELGEIEAELRRDPAVADTVVIAREDQSGDRRIVAYVVQREESLADPAQAERVRQEHLAQWESVWEETYRDTAAAGDPGFNLVGWVSSFSGHPIPADQMREWVDGTVSRILDLRPRTVVEVGCGTGLLLFRVAPRVESFLGLDLSSNVITALEAAVRRHEPPLPGVRLRQGTADCLEECVEPGSVDVVVLNSVAQYFPGADYFRRVVEAAVRAVRPGGTVFLGDLRSARLLPFFHASVQLHLSPADLPVADLRQRIHQSLQREQELAVDPGFFTALRRSVPRISSVEVRLKPGTSDNELTRYRYDVFLRVGNPGGKPASADAPAPSFQDWSRGAWSLDKVRRHLETVRPPAAGFSRVPNARLSRDARLVGWLSSEDPPPTVRELRDALSRESLPGVDVQSLVDLGQQLGYEVAVRWSAGGTGGEMDVVFCLPDGALPRTWFAEPAEPASAGPSTMHTNNPLQGVFARRLVPRLRQSMQQRLPEYMVPSAFVLLESVPRNPNGKLNRKALPPPDRGRLEAGAGFVPPREGAEEALAALWAELLACPRVGGADNFFDLGGHSLLATQLVSRVRARFGVEVPLRVLFEVPTLSGLAARIDAIRQPAAAGVVARQDPESLPLSPVPRDRHLPLSFAQQRLWFLAQYEPASGTYNIGPRFRLRGPVDAARLADALRAIQSRHESLRTAFANLAGMAVQKVHPAASLQLQQLDLRDRPEADRERLADEAGAAERLRPFDLAEGDCFRALLIRVGQEDWHLCLTLHHSACDGWSMGVLARELAAFYGAATAGHDPEVPPLPVQYADFAVWQREWMRGETLQRQLAYWRDRLAGAPPFLQLPTDRPRPALQTFRGRNHEVLLPRRLLDDVLRLCHDEDATLFMACLSVFALLLSRYTGQEDLCMGTPIANRNRREIENLIGFFVNTLVLRIDLGGNPTFRELVRRVRDVALGAYDHQDLPLEKLVEELQPERNLSYGPLFQVLFVVQNAPLEPLRLPGCAPSQLEYPGGTSKFDLTLFLEERSDGLLATLEYNVDLFDESTMARMMGHFGNLLSGVAARPAARLVELSMLGEPERHQLLETWNPPVTDYPSGLCAQQIFEAQVGRTPDAVAAMFEDSSLTYHDLNERANQLAHLLQNLGVGPDVRVVLSMERSLEMLVAMLAVLKAGGCYVPVDPGYPEERIRLMVSEARPKVVLTQERLAARFAAAEARVVCADRPCGEEPVSNPGPDVRNPDRLAYVIFTSGSTGRPKGVAMPHRPLVNLVHWQIRRSGLGVGDRTLQFASVSFDVHFQELFATWGSGGTVVVASEDLRRDPVSLVDRLAAWRIRRLFLPYVALQHLADAALERPDLRWDLREVITAGEALHTTPSVRGWFERMAGCVLENQYGPSETHVATAYRLQGAPSDWQSLPPIGLPIANTRAYVVTPGTRDPAPVGVPGELLLGGVCLARGYLDQPELTRERFIPSPFAGDERLYRTGDLARRLPDGNLEFLGRADQQVKIRGFRVELGEIEALLAEVPGVKEGVVVAEQHGRTRRLVGYVVAHAGASCGVAELRGFLASRVPDYMVPSVFLLLEKLPLLPSGKVNRRALPSPATAQLSAEAAYVAPQGDLEQTIAAAWREVLGVERVGVNDNFFELGGHSLLVVTLQSRLNTALKRTIPVVDLFRYPTVGSLARALGSAGSGAVELRAVQDRARRQREALARRKPGTGPASGGAR